MRKQYTAKANLQEQIEDKTMQLRRGTLDICCKAKNILHPPGKQWERCRKFQITVSSWYHTRELDLYIL